MTLFHYTNAQAVQSILSDNKIWLTDIRFLNDTKELHDGFSILSETLKKTKQGLLMNLVQKEKAIECIRSMLFQGKSYRSDLEPLFVFSFSSTNDQLSQWRAYGEYAIEFDKRVLKEYAGNIKQCSYDKKDKTKKATICLADAINTISKDMATCNGCIGPLSTDALIKVVCNAACFKHDGFIEENEHRIIMQSYNTTKYRSKENLLIPYIELEISLDCIKSIQVGPMKNQELAYTSMKEFVREIVSQWQDDSSNIEYKLPVIKSEIPYRG